MLRPDRAAPPPFTSAVAIEAARLAEFISPALAAYLLHPVAALYRRRLIAADLARESHIVNQEARLRLLRWAEVIAAAGPSVTFVGEFANAHGLYSDPDLRPVARLDVVVAPAELKPLVRHLGGHGFRATETALDGAVSLVAGDGVSIVVIHLGLFGEALRPAVPADQIARAGRSLELDGGAIRIPCPEHTLLLAASKAAEAGFGKLCVRDIVDVATLLRGNAAIDWPAVLEIAGTARLGKPLRTTLALLVDLGLDAATLPAALARKPRWPARRRFEHLADGYRALFQAA